MTGQIVIEFEGRGVPEIRMKGEITSRNITTLERFLRKHYRVYKHNMYKESQASKPAVAEAVNEPMLESPEPTPVADPRINLIPSPDILIEENVLEEEEETLISEDKDDDEEGTIGSTEGSGSISGLGEEVQ